MSSSNNYNPHSAAAPLPPNAYQPGLNQPHHMPNNYQAQNMYQAPNPAMGGSGNTQGPIPIYNYNPDQPLNNLPVENRPIVVVEHKHVEVVRPMTTQQRYYTRSLGDASALNCRNCGGHGCVYVQPTIDPCYCCLVIILTIIFFPFILMLCCPCGYTTINLCANCGHRWSV